MNASSDSKPQRFASLSEPDCTVIIPTHNRVDVLAQTLSQLARLSDAPVETIVVDNGSTDDMSTLRKRFPAVRWIELDRNLFAAARNVAAMAARGRILLMLDDDSWPADGTIDRLIQAFDARPALGAVACRVRLVDAPDRHDAGGVPGAFFNCGAAIRREAFLAAGGYPIDYKYYVEEYALSCELWRRGWVVDSLGAALVWHRRTQRNRDVDRTLTFLVRNNIRLWSTYAPESRRAAIIERDVERYRRVAIKENARDGYAAGLVAAEQHRKHNAIRRRPLTGAQFESLLGLDRLRQLLREQADKRRWRRVAIWSRGKACEFIIETAKSVGLNVSCVYDSHRADERAWNGLPLRDANAADSIGEDAVIAGTLSPGVAEDMCVALRSRFEKVDVINPAPWGDANVADDAQPVSRSCDARQVDAAALSTGVFSHRRAPARRSTV